MLRHARLLEQVSNGMMDPAFLGVADELLQKMPQASCAGGAIISIPTSMFHDS